MASRLLNSEEKADLLIVYKQFLGEFSDNRDYKSYLIKSRDFTKLWNRFLIKHFFDKELKRASLDECSSSTSSEQSVPFKEFELLKCIPKNMRQSTFFKDLNQKMETYVNENEKNPIKNCNVDEQILHYLNETCVDNFNCPMITTNYSNRTLDKFSCGKKSGSIAASMDQISRESDSRSQCSKSSGFRVAPHNRQFYLMNLGEHYFGSIATPILSELSKKDFEFLKEKCVGCDMKNATLFETINSDFIKDNVEVNKHSAEETDTEIYETLQEDEIQKSDTETAIADKEINVERLIKPNTFGVCNGRSKVPSNNFVKYLHEQQQIDATSDISKTTFIESISNPSEFLLPTINSYVNSQPISCSVAKRVRRCVFSPSLCSLPPRKLKKSKSCGQKTAKSLCTNTSHLKVPLTSKTNPKKFYSKFKGRRKGVRRSLKRVKRELSRNRSLSADGDSVKEDLIESRHYLVFGAQNGGFDKEQSEQWCFSQNKGLCYAPSDSSFPSCYEDEERDFGEIKQRANKVQQLLEHKSDYSKTKVESEIELKLICSNTDTELKSLDSICVSVPLDFKKYRCDSEKRALGPVKVIKGIPVFPLDKKFRSFSKFGKRFQLKEDIFEGFTKTDSENQKKMKKIHKKVEKFKQSNYLFPHISAGLNSKVSNKLQIISKTSSRMKQKENASFFSCVSGNEIILESVLDVETHGDDIFQRELPEKSYPEEKLHETLLSNIDKLVLIKVKHSGNRISKMHSDEGDTMRNAEARTTPRTNSGFEIMLKFAIESMEQEYMKRNNLDFKSVKSEMGADNSGSATTQESDRTSPTSESTMEENSLSMEEEGNLMKKRYENGSLSSKEMEMEKRCVEENLQKFSLAVESETNVSDKKVTSNIIKSSTVPCKNNTSSIRIYAGPEYKRSSSLVNENNNANICIKANNNNCYIENRQIPLKYGTESGYKFEQVILRNNMKVSTDGTSQDERRRQTMKNIRVRKTEQHNFCANTFKRKGPILKLPRVTSRFNVKPKAKSLSNQNTKMMEGKFIIYKSSETNNNFEVPKKSSFWGTMLKQTARLVPFFTFHGTKINLQTLSETLSR